MQSGYCSRVFLTTPNAVAPTPATMVTTASVITAGMVHGVLEPPDVEPGADGSAVSP
jgi:hypothetical protein